VRFTEAGLVELRRYTGSKCGNLPRPPLGQTLLAVWSIRTTTEPADRTPVGRPAQTAVAWRILKGRQPQPPHTHLRVRGPATAARARRTTTRRWRLRTRLMVFPLLACPRTGNRALANGSLFGGRQPYYAVNNACLPSGSTSTSGRSFRRHRSGSDGDRTCREVRSDILSEKPSAYSFRPICGRDSDCREGRPARAASTKGIYKTVGSGLLQDPERAAGREGWHVILLLTYSDQAFVARPGWRP